MDVLDIGGSDMEQNCIVWGAGNYGRRLIPILTENEYTIKAFCDSNTKLTGGG